MRKPERKVDAEIVRRLAEHAGFPLPEERISIHEESLKQQMLMIRNWDDLKLGFRFEDGKFTCVRPAVTHLLSPKEWTSRYSNEDS